jgi:predicted nucleotidyltransferase
MASSLPLPQPNKIGQTLAYFDKYDFPLTKEELVYWQSVDDDNKNVKYQSHSKFYFLSGRQKIVALRKKREKISQDKWAIAKQVGDTLKKFKFIQAVFVTGSLAMNNTKLDDDIDLMVVTSPDVLWIVRFFVNFYLRTVRRYPGQQLAKNAICINLWLDISNLEISPQSLYVAHEIMQAKVLWDRNNVSNMFLGSNVWVKNYLPKAYPAQPRLPSPKAGEGSRVWYLWAVVNYLFFLVQYIYTGPFHLIAVWNKFCPYLSSPSDVPNCPT